MKINQDLSESVRKMRKLGLDRDGREEISRKAYSLVGRLMGRKMRLERELEKFTVYNNRKAFYQDRPKDKDKGFRDYSREISLDFTKGVLYKAVSC